MERDVHRTNYALSHACRGCPILPAPYVCQYWLKSCAKRPLWRPEVDHGDVGYKNVNRIERPGSATSFCDHGGEHSGSVTVSLLTGGMTGTCSLGCVQWFALLVCSGIWNEFASFEVFLLQTDRRKLLLSVFDFSFCDVISVCGVRK